ncbi:ABC transporter substrate-binding protein [Planosporangium thailandense]|uniref:ABC transporter substrate-binding protein n=1 Tax=Planosporangium thailandense TaxID=765197 RepID=A0ABX0Y1I5_9ACTN|nr:ABC transporter substrate-binding protein [Planosporangium thailandense]NJC71425.1 ABC transporter substrate-binding protein [Planosporangium thailandense]
MSISLRRPLGVALTAVVLAGGLAACGGNSGGSDNKAASGSQGGVKTIRIAATSLDSLPFMAILQVADKKGWFKDEGLSATFISGSGGGNTLRTVTTGDADIAITGGPAVVLAAQGDPTMKIVGSWFQVNDFYWIGPKKPDSGAAMKLGTTGAGSTTQLLGKYVAKKMGSNVSTVEAGAGMGDSWAAAKSGSITAGWAMHPFVTDKVKNDNAQVVVTARDVVGDFPADMVAANGDFAKKNPDTLKAFFRAADKALNYVVSDTDAAAADLSPILKIDSKLLADGLRDTPDLKTAYSLKVNKKALETLSDIMVANGQITKQVDWSKVLDQSYLPDSAKAQL